MKRTILALALSLGAIVHADQDVLLISRNNGGNYETTATYSFRCMSHDVNKTRNNWDILFEGLTGTNLGDGRDTFRVNTVTDDNSSIYDLGQGPCPQIPGKWLGLLNSRNGQNRSSDNIPVIADHCYLVDEQDTDGSVVAMFEVKTHIPGIAVMLSDITVMAKEVREGLKICR